MSSQISRLSAVCKVLFDAEVIALRKENEELKLSLFWVKYSAKKLHSAIKRGNEKILDIPRNCSCEICFYADRFFMEGCTQFDETLVPNEICEWRPLFEAKLVELGIGFSSEPATKATIRRELEVVPDCDTHIVNLLSDDLEFFYKDTLHDWSEFAYGSKLCEATTVNDPELQKLVALFEWLVPPEPIYKQCRGHHTAHS